MPAGKHQDGLRRSQALRGIFPHLDPKMAATEPAGGKTSAFVSDLSQPWKPHRTGTVTT